MKRILMVAIAIAAINFSASAQVDRADKKDGARMEHKGQHKGGMDDLNLTAEQQTKLKAQRAEMKTQMDAIKSSTASEDAKKQQMMNLRKKQQSQFQSLLTPEQTKIWNDKKKSHEGMGNSKGKMEKGKKMSDELGLSSTQKEKMKAIHQDFKKQADAIKADNSLTQEQKKEKFQTLRKLQKEKSSNILTAEQKQKAAEMRKDQKEKRGMNKTR